ncbi:MAG TPA: hypothetical protein VEA59_04630 [Patescibacteria group bacterium]|nr:hypothetical protein [Patescibacteria group bacterium]
MKLGRQGSAFRKSIRASTLRDAIKNCKPASSYNRGRKGKRSTFLQDMGVTQELLKTAHKTLIKTGKRKQEHPVIEKHELNICLHVLQNPQLTLREVSECFCYSDPLYVNRLLPSVVKKLKRSGLL